MESSHAILDALAPVLLLLALGIVAAMASRKLKLSPIVGYLVLGIGISAAGAKPADMSLIGMLAELGVVFLLFDIGLHFSLKQVREQASDIFGFGTVQVVFCTVGLGLVAFALGLPPLAAFLVGAMLSLSSTAVVARLIAERHQQSCPVGLTATSILVFQDVVAIFLLIVASALAGDGVGLLPAIGEALAKAAAAFGIAVLLARLVVRPLFDLIARTDNEEVFTASALLIALAAGWATGSAGLSLTLGAFLGGMIVAETPFRPVVQAETRSFRGLLLGFFFIAVGMSLDVGKLGEYRPQILAAAAGLILVKIVLNGAASLVFRWSVPGSAQLGFLLAQGSEFALVMLSLPAIRTLLGEEASVILVASVALTLALTPSVADLGRQIAGRLRQRRQQQDDPELRRREEMAPVFIIGMGEVGRTLADALTEFGIDYKAVERDHNRFRLANADGYRVAFGDAGDPRLWGPLSMDERRYSVITAPNFEIVRGLDAVAGRLFPDLVRVAVVASEEEAALFSEIGLAAIIDAETPRGLRTAAELLPGLGADAEQLAQWIARRRAIEREDESSLPLASVA
jgi:CPA2 family monovalent cation:H+ antiporter-2